MNTYITKENGTYWLNEEGQAPVPIEVKCPKGWEPTLVLPENSSGRKLINENKLMKCLEKNPIYELSPKGEVHKNPQGQSRSVKGLEEYLDGEEKELFLNLIEKARENKKKSMEKPKLSEKEKLEKKIEKYRKMIEEIESKEIDFEPLGELE